MRAVALGNAGNDADNIEVHYETVGGVNNDEDADVYARIQRRRPLPEVEVHQTQVSQTTTVKICFF